MAYTRRTYAGGAAATTISGSLASNGTSITIAAYTGWPYHATDPFYVVVAPGTATEEKILVTRTTSTSTTLNVVTRGVDGTTAAAQASGATIYPVFTAVDADEANAVAATLTTKGDLLTYTGSAYARTGVGANNTLLVADSAQTNGIKWSDDLTLGSLVVSENASTDAVRITQTGAGNALVVEDSANPDSTPLVIDNSGALIVGHTSAVTASRVESTGTGAAAFAATYFAANSSGPHISGYKSRNATVGSHTAVQAADDLVLIRGYGSDGTNYNEAGRFTIEADGTISTGVVPGNLKFHTTDSGGTLRERMNINSAGSVTFPNSYVIADQFQENWNIVASAATGTINFDYKTASVWYYTSNATANHTLNVRGDSSTTLSSLLAVGDSVTVVWANTNGTTAYYPSTFQIDGSSVTPKWQGGTAPTAGNASSVDLYVYTIVKTAATPTYTVFASQTKFA
jgi:hypothetical protein